MLRDACQSVVNVKQHGAKMHFFNADKNYGIK